MQIWTVSFCNLPADWTAPSYFLQIIWKRRLLVVSCFPFVWG